MLSQNLLSKILDPVKDFGFDFRFPVFPRLLFMCMLND